jgi:hypothetical protein
MHGIRTSGMRTNGRRTKFFGTRGIGMRGVGMRDTGARGIGANRCDGSGGRLGRQVQIYGCFHDTLHSSDTY